jgi:hypothetical protein
MRIQCRIGAFICMISFSRGRVAYLVYILYSYYNSSGFPPHQKAVEKLKHTHFNIYIHKVYFKLAPSLQKMFFFIQGGDFVSQWPNFDALAAQKILGNSRQHTEFRARTCKRLRSPGIDYARRGIDSWAS